MWPHVPTQSLGGASYFVTFIDDATRKVWTYAMNSKDETFSHFMRFSSLVARRSKPYIQKMVAEYIANEFSNFYIARGIGCEFTP